MDSSTLIIAIFYIAIGLVGVLLNGTTVFMIVSQRVYRLSAYTIMANVALADALMMLILGICCGTGILYESAWQFGGGGATVVLVSSNSGVQQQQQNPPPPANGFLPSTSRFGGHSEKLLSTEIVTTFQQQHQTWNHHPAEGQGNKPPFFHNARSLLHLPSSPPNNALLQQTNALNVGGGETEDEENIRTRTTPESIDEERAPESTIDSGDDDDLTAELVRPRPRLKREHHQTTANATTKTTTLHQQLEVEVMKNSSSTTASEAAEDNRRRLETDEEETVPAVSFTSFFRSALAFLGISAWMAGVSSYAFLGVNRCVAIRYYGTRARQFNRVGIAHITSAVSWTIGIAIACIGTYPEPLVDLQSNLLSVGFQLGNDGSRPALFMSACLFLNTLSIALQWICSTLVLHKIRQVKKKISRNKINQDSANRFRRQARITFQFFYPSIFCTISSILYFTKPFLQPEHEFPANLHFILLHLVRLGNHICNPFIYAYFNERMRGSYQDLFTCVQLRMFILRRKQKYLNDPLNLGGPRVMGRSISRRSAKNRRSAPVIGSSTQKRAMVRHASTRTVGARTNNNGFVRTSLQMQSKDFEQLCEFMMRVNPLYESSEGWHESSSSDSEDEEAVVQRAAAAITNEDNNNKSPTKNTAAEEALLNVHRADLKREGGGTSRGSSKSIVLLELGRETVESWAKFAKKASI